jgi:NADH:ubiquinone oxidoreductase subunit F (NADH-binding)
LNDVFNITVSGAGKYWNTETMAENNSPFAFRLIPSIIRRGEQLFVQTGNQEQKQVKILDISGRQVKNFQMNQTLFIPTEYLLPGVYLVRVTGRSKPVTRKIVVTE